MLYEYGSFSVDSDLIINILVQKDILGIYTTNLAASSPSESLPFLASRSHDSDFLFVFFGYIVTSHDSDIDEKMNQLGFSDHINRTLLTGHLGYIPIDLRY